MFRGMRTVFVLVIILLSLPTFAVSAPCPDDEWVQRGLEAAKRSRDEIMIDHTNRTANANNIMDVLAQCLEKFKNLKAGATLGVPSLGDLFAGIAQKACSTADSLYNQAVSGVQTQVMLPGNVGGAKIGLPSAGQMNGTSLPSSAVSVPGADVAVTKSSGGIFRDTINKVPNYIRGIFQ